MGGIGRGFFLGGIFSLGAFWGNVCIVFDFENRYWEFRSVCRRCSDFFFLSRNCYLY